MTTFIEFLHNNSSITTLEGFVEENLIVINDDFSLNDLLNYDGNNTRMVAAYTTADGSSASVDILRSPTVLRVPIENVPRETIAVTSNIVTNNTSFQCFVDDKIRQITQHEGYKPLVTDAAQAALRGNAYKILSNCTVWCWSRAFGKLLNLTPFVQSVVTNVGANGGNFSIRIAPLLCEYDEKQGWVVSRTSMDSYLFRGTNFVVRDSIFKEVDGEFVRKPAFFHTLLSSNDVIFLQFEALDMERNTRVVEGNDFITDGIEISTSSLPDRVFDMIGLIDVNSEAFNPNQSSLSVTITGRDLMKLVIEDGCYFFPIDFTNENGGFVNVDGSPTAMQRIVSGELPFFNSYVDRSLEFTLKFILNQLSSVEVVSDDLFQFYTERAKRYVLKDSSAESQENQTVTDDVYATSGDFKEEDSKGIWQAVRVVIDSKIAARRIVDSSISSDSGSLLNFIQKVCQPPFVEFYGDTWGDKYYFIVRKPPFTQDAIKSYIDNELVIDVGDNLLSTNLNFDEQGVFSWYRLVPKGNFFGKDEIALADFPAIYFDRYAKIWGSRPLEIVSNYIDYFAGVGEEGSVNLEYLKQQSMQDLAFIVETNAYNPFVRTGTITIKGGDRRIKRGNFVRIKATGEIGYVESVNQTVSFSANLTDRDTVVNLSRVMVEKHITDEQYNYFNIINLNKDISGKSTSNDFKVNDEVFDFFIQKKQMA